MSELIEFYLSGGAGNSDPNASLGGIISTTQLTGQTAVYDGAGISGLTLLDAAGNLAGVGTLEYINSSTTARWTKPGGTAAGAPDEINVGTNGDYVLIAPEGDAFLTVNSVAASLPVSDTSDTVTIANILDNLFDAVSASESKAGRVEYRCIYITNLAGATKTAKCWIQGDFIGVDQLQLGSRFTISGNTEATIATETDEPFSVTFGNYISLATALSLTLNTAESIGIWFRRTVDPLTSDSTAIDYGTLAIEIT